MNFKITQSHITYPETLKRDLDKQTRHGYEAVDVEKNNLVLDKSVKTYNFLIPENTKQMREYYRNNGYGYVELAVTTRHIRMLGLTITKVARPTRESANYLLVKSLNREPVMYYREILRAYHEEETKKYLPLTIIYAIFYTINLIMRNKIATKIGNVGYYILEGIVIVLLVISLYHYLRHKQFKEDME